MDRTQIVSRFQQMTARLDGISAYLPVEIGRHLSAWYRSTADKCVTDEPEVVERLGARLSTLKMEINAAAAGVPEQVRQALEPSSQLWVHRSGFDVALIALHHKPSQMPQAFISKLEPLTSNLLSETLGRYGFRAHHVPLSFPREIIAAASEYISLVMEQRKLMCDLDNAEGEQKRDRAAELWRKA